MQFIIDMFGVGPDRVDAKMQHGCHHLKAIAFGKQLEYFSFPVGQLVAVLYPLLFFHFYGVKRSGRYYFNSHRLYHAPFSDMMRQRIYEPYIAVLAESELTVASHLEPQPIETIRPLAVASPRDYVSNALRKGRAVINRGLDVVTGRAMASPGVPVR